MTGETITDYRILALAGLDGKDDNGPRSQAALLIEAVDPCVGYQLRVQ